MSLPEGVSVRLTGRLARYFGQSFTLSATPQTAVARSETGHSEPFAGQEEGVQIAAGRSVLEVAAEIGIPRQQPFVAVVNGRTVDLNHVLAPGDCLTLVPPIAGG